MSRLPSCPSVIFSTANSGSTWSGDTAMIEVRAASNHGPGTSYPTEIVWSTTPQGSTTAVENMTLGQDGSLLMSTSNKHLFRDTALGIYSQADTFLDLFADGAVRIGDSSGGAPTHYLNIDTSSDSGDAWWVGSGSGWPYACMYVDGTQVIIVALTTGVIAEVKDDDTTSLDDGWLAGDLNLITFPTGGDEHYLSVTKAGFYRVQWSLSFNTANPGANVEIHGGIAVDGTAIRNKAAFVTDR